jgi:hypothetical protein
MNGNRVENPVVYVAQVTRKMGARKYDCDVTEN